MIAAMATSPSGERGRVVAEGQQRAAPRRRSMLARDAPPACCIALLLFSTRGVRQRANAVDLVSQGRPRSARCGRLVEPAVLAASDLVGAACTDAPRAERIEPGCGEQPGRARARASLELQATTVENNNAMLVVMKMLMRSDTP